MLDDYVAYFVPQSKFCQVTFFLLPFGVGLSICRREAGGGIREGVRIQSLRFSIIATVFGLFAIGAVNVRAQSVNSTNLLTQAYAVISVADHDYKGHRVAAMKQIAAAAKVVGVTEMGNGKGHEQQVVSDQQLQIATNSL